MTLSSLYAPASANVESTYFSLARQIEGHKSVEGEGFVAAIGSFEHPICNFAVCHENETLDVIRLAAMAKNRPYFNVYVPNPKAEPSIDPRLAQAGFTRTYVLIQMGAAGRAHDSFLAEATTTTMRSRLSAFMAQQFFGLQSASVRSRVATATAAAPELELYAFGQDDFTKPTRGAVMLHQTPRILGLYNLCVATELRGRGYGSEIVKCVLDQGAVRGMNVALQCDPRLANWYTGLGFNAVGSIGVYALR